MVEHATVNRRVVGSSPTRGAEKRQYMFNNVLPFLLPRPIIFESIEAMETSETTGPCSLYILYSE
jgi:hypothetical protein